MPMTLRNANILVVDDDTDVLTAVRLLLKTQVQLVVTEKNPEILRGVLRQQKFDVLLLDMNFNATINTGNEGLFWLREVKKISPDTALIMITAYGSIDLAVRCLKEGAADFIIKPWHNEKLIATISECLKNKGQKKSETIADNIIGKTLLGESDLMQDIFLKLKKIAPTDANVLMQNPKIHLSALSSPTQQVEIKVSDNGCGIPEDVLDKIFIPFFSTRKSGSGIGLSLCKQIMMLHKGTIQVQSTEGVGTVFSLQF
jgi:FixJ family two-component response regulator